MKRSHRVSFLVFISLLLLVSVAAAAPVAQEVAAAITEFSTTEESVFDTELNAGTARASVSWAVDNRPDNSNLVFEQVLADGRVVNIELPRDFVLVSDTGQGVVAPRPPGGAATTVDLRVRLIDLGGVTVYDESQIILNIAETPPVVPIIESFMAELSTVNADQLEDGEVRIPVEWSVINRPANSNLVFEQILADESVVNVELPRDNQIIPSSGIGVVAPRVPGGESSEIVLQMRFIDLGGSRIYARSEFRIAISESPVGNIQLFEVDDVADRARLAAGSERLTVSWNVNLRPTNSNLVFEQVLADGSVVNVELPRDFVVIQSSGTGVVAPRLPGDGGDSITIQMRLIDLTSNTPYAIEQQTVDIEDAPQATISSFTTEVTQIDRAILASGQARVPVSWEVERRPSGSNLVFEQVMPDNSVINVEYLRDVVLVPSSGDGAMNPQMPQSEVTGITLQVRLVDIASDAVYDREQITLPIVENATAISSFTSTATTVNQAALDDGTARIPVAWAVSARPDGSNLVFEALLADGSTENVELPRSVPIVPSSGAGVVAPTFATDAGQLIVQVRLIDVTTGAEYDSASLNFAVTSDPVAEASISIFSTNSTGVDRDEMAAGTERVPVTWAVVNRPANSNLAFEQVLADGSSANVELPRNFIIIPSEGTGSVAPRLPAAEATQITLRVRLFAIGSAQVYDQREITVPINAAQTIAPIDAVATEEVVETNNIVEPVVDTGGGETEEKPAEVPPPVPTVTPESVAPVIEVTEEATPLG